MTKKELAIMLSKLKTFANPKPSLEQYPTDSEAAAEILHFAELHDGLKNKKILDLGAGTGILGIGASILGANPSFVEIDPEAISTLRENLSSLNIKGKIILNSVSHIKEKADIIFMNPPFGIQKKHADREFLKKAFTLSKIIYSFHSLDSEEFVEKQCEKNNFRITNRWHFDFPLKKTMAHHKTPVKRIKVVCFRMEKH